MESRLETARRFAGALDREDYAAAGEYLSPDCEYTIGEATHRGPAEILASYRAAGDWVSAALDAVTYESAVRSEPTGAAVVTFVDHLCHRGERHTHRCEQRLEFEETGRICRIEHVDLPGEVEGVRAFLDRMGVSRDS